MAKTRKLIAGNWKMNGTKAGAQRMASALRARLMVQPVQDEVLICPPAPLIGELAQAFAGSRVAIGGQDCHDRAQGAHTGDIAAAQLLDAGCSYVIVGHSERRCNHGESDALVKAKAQAAIDVGLIPVLCLGETAAERAAGDALTIIERQLQASLPDVAAVNNLVVAYEPIWAIGSSVTPSAQQIGEAHRHLRACLTGLGPEKAAIRLLYGGSVKAANAAAILRIDNVDGVLVGGASLEAEEFFAIIASCP